jgi:hypothetical protein
MILALIITAVLGWSAAGFLLVIVKAQAQELNDRKVYPTK